MQRNDHWVPCFGNVTQLPTPERDAALATEAPAVALALAWLLRQHAPHRARTLLQALSLETMPVAAQVRGALMQAEWHQANAELDAAQGVLERIKGLEGWGNVAALQADRCLVERALALSQGNHAMADARTLEALRWAKWAKDPDRMELATALMAWDHALIDAASAHEKWSDAIASIAAVPMAPAAGWAQATLGLMRYGQGRPDEAARAYATAFDLLVTYGQTLWATVCAVNLAFVHEDLRDHEAALAWAQRGLGVARATGAAIPTGLALVVLGERLRRLALWEPARAALDEAQVLLQPIRSARNYALLLNEQGALDAAQGMFASALTHFKEARSRALDLGDDYLLVTALLGMAEASLGLQDAPAAEHAAQAGLEAAQRARRPSAEAEALAVLARCQAAR